MADDAEWRQRAEDAYADAARAAVAIASALPGLDEDAARSRIERAGCEMRVVERDAESFPRRADRRTTRVNVAIERGIVTAAEVY
jgi:hypothetical protein